MAAPVPREIELKLRTSPEALAVLRDCDLLRSHTRSVGKARNLVGTYYDTSDGRLASRGLALRLRRDGRQTIQTLKAAPSRGDVALDRDEWEIPLAAAAPDLTAFGDPRVLDRTGLVLPDELAPLFETRVRRETVLVEWPDGRGPAAVIELAFDTGTIVAGKRRLPIAELELELKEGAAPALFALAQRLGGLAPLAIERQDKAARGRALAMEASPPSRKAGSLELPSDVDVETGLGLILRHGLAHWLDNEAAARHGTDPEGVHQLRVALRRLRSALSIFREVLAPSVRARWNDELRWLLGCLGSARDLDVLTGDLLAPLAGERGIEGLVDPLVLHAGEARATAYRELRACLDEPRYAALGLGLAAWIERRGWREDVDVDVLVAQRAPLRELAARSLARSRHKARKQGADLTELSPDARHELRKTLKKLRYGVEFFADLFDRKDGRHFQRRLADLQDGLGHLNDVAVTRKLVSQLVTDANPAEAAATALGAGTVVGWYAARQAAVLPDVAESFAAFRDIEPFWETPA